MKPFMFERPKRQVTKLVDGNPITAEEVEHGCWFLCDNVLYRRHQSNGHMGKGVHAYAVNKGPHEYIKPIALITPVDVVISPTGPATAIVEQFSDIKVGDWFVSGGKLNHKHGYGGGFDIESGTFSRSTRFTPGFPVTPVDVVIRYWRCYGE